MANGQWSRVTTRCIRKRKYVDVICFHAVSRLYYSMCLAIWHEYVLLQIYTYLNDVSYTLRHIVIEQVVTILHS